MGTSLPSVDRRREISGLVYRQFYVMWRRHSEVGSFSTVPPSGISWGTAMMGNPRTVCLASPCGWNQRWPLVRSCTSTWVVANGTWKKQKGKIVDKKVWVMWIGKKYEDTLSHINALYRAASAKDGFNNQESQVTSSVDLFPQPHCHCSWTK